MNITQAAKRGATAEVEGIQKSIWDSIQATEPMQQFVLTMRKQKRTEEYPFKNSPTLLTLDLLP